MAATDVRRRRGWLAWLFGALAVVFLGGLTSIGPSAGSLSLPASRRDLVVALTEAGVLRPAESITYRSPFGGREASLTFLAAEGAYVEAGEPIATLDSSEVSWDLDRAVDASRQAEVALAIALAERDDAAATLQSVTDGERALDVEEAEVRLRYAERAAERLREEQVALGALLDRGFVTRDELDQIARGAEQAELELGVLKKRVGLLTGRTMPQEEQRARLQLAQREAQVANARQRLRETTDLVSSLRAAVAASSIVAQRAGLVVHEELMSVQPRRRVRVGDRIGTGQGIVTIPEVDRMLVDSSVREADMWRVRPGQRVDVGLDAFPGMRLNGTVVTVGTLGRGLLERSFEEKRFAVSISLDETPRELRPEMTARVRIVVAERPSVLTVPVSAVTRSGDDWITVMPGVFRLHRRIVTLGERDSAHVEVVSGLVEGEHVLLDPSSVPLPVGE